MSYRCLVVEDEAPAQRVLKKFIEDVPQLKLIGTVSNPLNALSFLNEHEVDILFLDINLPKIKGVEFLRSVQNPPQTIFTTAYTEYAIDGFELNAVDYLLKPFSFERFLKAVNKATDRIAYSESPNATEPKNDDYVYFKSDKKIIKIDLSELIYIEGVKDYVRLVLKNENHLILQTLKHWELNLPKNQFKRVHKSFIVNLRMINSINGNNIIIGNEEIPIGRSFKENLLKHIENNQLI